MISIIIYIACCIYCINYALSITYDDINEALNIAKYDDPYDGPDAYQIYDILIILSFIPVINTLYAGLIIYIELTNKNV